MTYTINISDIRLDSVLHFLGYKGKKPDSNIQDEIELLTKKFINIIATYEPKCTAGEFTLQKEEVGIKIAGTNLILPGNDIKRLLKYSDKCIIIAATLGTAVDRLIAYTQKVSLSEAVILDAIASAAIESVCDGLEAKLSLSYTLTNRYSCGYGDLPLEIQPKIMDLLDTGKAIGLFCTPTNIMTPRKSITAILGITKSPKLPHQMENNHCQKNCSDCSLKQNCNLRKAE